MSDSKIEWTDKTWNPVRGCSLVSAGCTNCYAMRQGHRQSGPGGAYEGLTRRGRNGPTWTGVVGLVPEVLEHPFRWSKPRRIFVNSMSDLFHESLDAEAPARIFAVMALAHWHTFQVLTKRPERMLALLNDDDFRCQVGMWISMMLEDEDRPPALRWDAFSRLRTDARATAPDVEGDAWPLLNVWLGVSVENRSTLNRIDILRDTPAAVRFVSFEPLLEDLGAVNLTGVDWAIIGGESGHGARPCDLKWIRDLISQIRAGDCACFVKQLGANPFEREEIMPEDPDHFMGWTRVQHVETGDDAWYRYYRLYDRKGGDMEKWPHDLRIREMPKGVDR